VVHFSASDGDIRSTLSEPKRDCPTDTCAAASHECDRSIEEVVSEQLIWCGVSLKSVITLPS
jgi:hypothetical protein